MAELIDLVVSLLDEASACESCSVFITDARWRARLVNLLFGVGKAADIAADWIVVAQLMDGGIFSERTDTQVALVVAIGCAVLGTAIEVHAGYLKIQKQCKTKEGAVRTLEMVRLNRELALPRFSHTTK